MKQLSFSQAVEGYLLYAHSRRLSEHTVRDYQNSFSRLQEFLAPRDPSLASITIHQIEAFFADLNHLSKKTLLNYHVGLSALWTWAMKRRVVEEHILRLMDPPKPEKPIIEIFTEEEVQKLLNACDWSRSYRRPGKRKCSNKRPTALRDKAIILTLLDSMVRVTESCEMLRSDMDLKQGTIKVNGKGDKERVVSISEETSEAIWHYLAVRPTAKPKYDDLVFRHGSKTILLGEQHLYN